MEKLETLSKELLSTLVERWKVEYENYQAQGLKLDMSRGKPSPVQLDLSMGMLDELNAHSDMHTENGLDTRNYGALEGIPEARRWFADMLEVKPEEIFIGGNSSLNLMYDSIVRALLLGVYGGKQPWGKQGALKFLCPVPGYDRHFAITELFGFEMINVPLNADGPDMDMIERLIAADSSIKGIWCVPKYANPSGCVYSDETVRRFARLKPAADDFRIFWDNAYAMHDLYPKNAPKLLNIFEACAQEGSEDHVLCFTSTSKISFSGAGLSCIAASKNNIALISKQIAMQTIGYDKMNQLRHTRFYPDKAHMTRHMAMMADVIRPKFEAVLHTFEEELGGGGVATWTNPQGGYFISVDGPNGCAKRTIELCKAAGVTLTGAGCAFPYGKDPHDSNIRIAPTYPSPEELELAAKLFCLCLKLAAAEKLLGA